MKFIFFHLPKILNSLPLTFLGTQAFPILFISAVKIEKKKNNNFLKAISLKINDFVRV